MADTDSAVTLVLDTCNRWIVLGLFGPDLELTQVEDAQRESSSRTIPMIRDLLRTAGIQKPDRLVCTVGPGSFTGTRISVATARNLAQLWDISVRGIVSLRFYAHDIQLSRKESEMSDREILVMLDGKQQRVYAVIYPPAVQTDDTLRYLDNHPAEILKLRSAEAAQPICYGDDPRAIGALFAGESNPIPVIEPIPRPDPRTLLMLAEADRSWTNWEHLHPLYLRTDPASALYPDGFQHGRKNY
ncbi:MAG: tRNA (adenosine(37)-N6)-threonylcarbamoyltransferase complex dimerization subunit type 1 TsaB [Leptospiraceae bacterium]|nr:tRNA (adenosine(37)-N6)-threonylcarbamoyltransferase complex dimerization subunit type 1 TsaB [Leptospiraceae bacterium]